MLASRRLLAIYATWLVVSGGCGIWIRLQRVQAAPFLNLLLSKPHNWTTAAPLPWDFERLERSTVPFIELRNFVNRSNDAPAASDEDFLNRFNELRAHFAAPQPSSSGPTLLSAVLNIFNLDALSYDITNRFVPCTNCRVGVQLLLLKIKSGRRDEDIINTISVVCSTLGIQSSRVCEGIARDFGKELIHVMRRVQLSPHEICNVIFGEGCPAPMNPQQNWDVVLPAMQKPPITAELPIPNEGAPFFKVLHLSDPHYDPQYQAGSNSQCNEPLCCRADSGRPANKAAIAGKWGSWKCDSPKILLDNMLDHIAATHTDIDFIYWTGDLPPHDVWNQSRTTNLEILKATVQQMTDKFPGVPIFPALGNHETFPVNSFPSPILTEPDLSISWLYDELDIQWKRWLPASTSNTIRRGAFYSVLARPGFRIISLNMNHCNNLNWWLLLNSTDPATELQWLIFELQNAELANEKVHIIGHIPPGNDDCLTVWSRNFYKIISRYERTITAQFYGHTHYDEYELFYDPNNLKRATNIAYIGPSVTPHVDLNPGYRIYYVDGEHEQTTHLVIDHETWIMDLQKANRHDNPEWYKLYTARGAFNMTALRPTDWDKLIERMANNRTLFDYYHTFYWKNSPLRPFCDENCRKRLLCDCRSGRSHFRKKLCENLQPGTPFYNGLKDSLIAVHLK